MRSRTHEERFLEHFGTYCLLLDMNKKAPDDPDLAWNWLCSWQNWITETGESLMMSLSHWIDQPWTLSSFGLSLPRQKIPFRFKPVFTGFYFIVTYSLLIGKPRHFQKDCIISEENGARKASATVWTSLEGCGWL